MPVAKIWINDRLLAEGTYTFRELGHSNASLPGLGGRPSAQLPGSARFEYDLEVEGASLPLSQQQGEHFLLVGDRHYEFDIVDIESEDEKTGAGQYRIVTQHQLPAPGADAAGALNLMPE